MTKRLSTIHRCESGTIIVMFAVCVSLAVLLCIGIAIQKPTDDANASKLQHALTIATSNSIRSVSRPNEAAQAAYTTAVNIMNNEYSTDQVGFFSPGVNEFYAWIPVIGPTGGSPQAPDLNDFAVFSCAAGGCGLCDYTTNCRDASLMERQLEIARRTFDLTDGGEQIDDHLNGIMVYATSDPFRYFTYLGSKRQEAASAAVLNPQVTYVLIDPAFSMQENYRFMFGDENTDPADEDRYIDFIDTQWPIMFDRHDPNMPPRVGETWEYPNTPGLYQILPTNDTTFTNWEVYRFFSSLCFSAGWDYYKEAAVSFIDYLSVHSAYSRTTLVALTGPGPIIDDEPPVIPVHPILEASNPAELDTTFPQDATLYEAKPLAFTGFIDSLNPAKNANYGPDNTLGTPDDIGSGFNQWELCMCRGLANDETGNESPFTLVADSTSPSPPLNHLPTEALDHRPEAKRERGSAANNWCSDSTVPEDRNAVDLNLSRHGLQNGESVRNIIAGLGIRVNDLKLERLIDTGAPTDTVLAENWNRGTGSDNGPPGAPAFAPTDTAAVDDPMNTGWRYLPDSIESACESIVAARTGYNADALYGEERPINADASMLTVFAFGVWSPGAEDFFLSAPPPLQKDEDEMLAEFVEAVGRCVCEQNIRVVLAFLPMNAYDRTTVTLAANALSPIQTLQNNQCQDDDTIPIGVPPTCLASVDPRLNVFVVDYLNPYFSEFGALDPLNDEAQIKINAAKFFRDNIPNAIRHLVTRFRYHI